MSQPKLAAELGVTVTTVWRWENGQSPIGNMAEKAIERLAAAPKSGEAA